MFSLFFDSPRGEIAKKMLQMKVFACHLPPRLGRMGEHRNAMKHFLLSKNTILSALALAAAACLASCSGTPSAGSAADVLKQSVSATVFSYNDTSSPKVRDCVEAGPLPARAANALATWLRESTRKSFSYVYPQYYVALQNKNGGTSVWGLCSDGQGNLVGVVVPRHGVPAWDIPYASEHVVYVCETAQRKDLSKAIMDSLADAGYDEYRLGVRRASGLTQKRYLISKPLSDEEQKRLEKIRQAELAAAAAQSAGNSTEAAPVDDSGDDFDLGGGDASSDDDSSSSSDTEDSSDDASDDAGGEDDAAAGEDDGEE